jgi:hypothetical protein
MAIISAVLLPDPPSSVGPRDGPVEAVARRWLFCWRLLSRARVRVDSVAQGSICDNTSEDLAPALHLHGSVVLVFLRDGDICGALPARSTSGAIR